MIFQHIPTYAGDPILSLVETFLADPRPNKVNLSIGIYFDENGCLSQTASVAHAQAQIQAQARSYLPMEGDAAFRKAMIPLLFHAQHQSTPTAIVQTLGGSGALKLGADFLKNWFPNAQAHISNPTWDNHRGIFEGAGIPVQTYPYYHEQAGSVDFDALCAYLNQLPANDIVLLHPCCHNPTGVDLSKQQWDTLLQIIQTRALIPFMDMAYHGFGNGFEHDAYAIHQAVNLQLPLFISYSFSKNMSLYSERVGALIVSCGTDEEADRVLGQLKAGVRRIYSSPPTHGSLIASAILNDEQQRQQWQNEVAHMKNRIQTMRQRLFDLLSQRVPHRDFQYFIQQKGMFSYTGFNVKQVHQLRQQYGIYLLDSGRMCVAGLNENNIEYVAHAFAERFQSQN